MEARAMWELIGIIGEFITSPLLSRSLNIPYMVLSQNGGNPI